MCVCVCVCVCVWVGGGGGGGVEKSKQTHSKTFAPLLAVFKRRYGSEVVKDGEPRTATSTLTQLHLVSAITLLDNDVGFNSLRCRAELLGTIYTTPCRSMDIFLHTCYPIRQPLPNFVVARFCIIIYIILIYGHS